MGLTNHSEKYTIPPDEHQGDLVAILNEWREEHRRHASTPTEQRNCVIGEDAGIAEILRERRNYLRKHDMQVVATRTFDAAKPYVVSLGIGVVLGTVYGAAHNYFKKK
jgi:hypothetical protein